MPQLRCFSPVADADAKVLILGSMPGAASLRANQYYAHPRNLFWRIIGELTGADPASPYAHRLHALKSARIALWDVLQSCTRQGSLDADIDDATLVPNDFESFFRCHPDITRVFFNGAKAEQCYRKYVLPFVGTGPIEYLRLPSTSPAHAAMSFERKLDAWRAVTERGPDPADR